MDIFNLMFSKIIPYFPKIVTYQFAKKYVAGTNKKSAFKTVASLNNDGYLVTLDILGEHTRELETANNITEQYIDLYNEINNRNLNCNISLKPSHIGADINIDTYNNNLDKIINVSEATNNFLRIDMESSKYTDFTIKSFVKKREIVKIV